MSYTPIKIEDAAKGLADALGKRKKDDPFFLIIKNGDRNDFFVGGDRNDVLNMICNVLYQVPEMREYIDLSIKLINQKNQ